MHPVASTPNSRPRHPDARAGACVECPRLRCLPGGELYIIAGSRQQFSSEAIEREIRRRPRCARTSRKSGESIRPPSRADGTSHAEVARRHREDANRGTSRGGGARSGEHTHQARHHDRRTRHVVPRPHRQRPAGNSRAARLPRLPEIDLHIGEPSGLPRHSEREAPEERIVNVDITVIKDGFGDTSRMMFVGEPSIAARRLCRVAREAMWIGIRWCVPESASVTSAMRFSATPSSTATPWYANTAAMAWTQLPRGAPSAALRDAGNPRGA